MVDMSEAAMLERAHAVHPAAWLSDEAFLAHVRAVVADLSAVPHAADLYLACACARGCAEALAVLEREHLTRLREVAAGVARSASELEEVVQRVRERLLVAEPGRAPRIATYSGRGSLGGWIRVTAVRVARDLWRGTRQHEPMRDELEPGVVAPELAYWKRAYGEVVSRAVQEALESLEGEPRALLKMHYVDGLSIDQVGLALGKSRATGARMLAAARQTLLAAIRERMVGALGVQPQEADSLLAFVRSRLELSLGRAFGR